MNKGYFLCRHVGAWVVLRLSLAIVGNRVYTIILYNKFGYITTSLMLECDFGWHVNANINCKVKTLSKVYNVECLIMYWNYLS